MNDSARRAIQDTMRVGVYAGAVVLVGQLMLLRGADPRWALAFGLALLLLRGVVAACLPPGGNRG